MNFKKFISGVSALTIAASAFAGMAVTANAAENLYLIKLNDNAPAVASFTNNGVGNTGRFTVKALAEGQTQDGITASSDCVYAVASGSTSGRYDYDLSSAIGSSTDFKISYDLAFYSEATKGRNHYIDLYSDNNTKILSFDGHGTKNTYPGVKTFADASYTTNSSIAINTWYTMNVAVKDGKLSASLKDMNGNSMWSATDVTYDAATQGAISKLSFVYGYSTGTLFLDNIYVSTMENTTVDSVEIAGADKVSSTAGTAAYTAAVKAGAYEVENPAITWAIDSQTATGASSEALTIADGVLTVPSGWAGTATISASSSGFSGTKNITVKDAVGYEITTTPYAAVSINGAEAVSSGADGKYQFAVGTEGTYSVEISKTGYQTISQSVSAVDDGTIDLTLTPSAGTYFTEDFAYVDDNFGFNAASGVTVAGGKITLVPTSSNSADMAATFANSVDYNGRCITLNISATSSSTNNIMNFYLDGTPIRFFVYGPNLVIYGTGSTSITIPRPNETTTIQITKGSKTQAQSLYVNGVQVSGKLYNNGSTTITGISAAMQKNSDFSFTLDDIAVTNMPSTAAITIDDDGTTSSTTYIAGTSFTLPAAAGKDGYTFEGWSDGENTYAAGTALTADATKTYTAVYTQIVAPSANLEKAAWTADAATGYEASGNVLTDAKGNSVYGYKATLDGNGYSYDTVKAFVTTLKGSTAEKTYDDTTFSATASGVVFYVISNVELDTDASRVYCE